MDAPPPRIGKYAPGLINRAAPKKNSGPLTTKKRKALPTSTFALPGRRYPINDPNHARAALSRASANASPAEQATIRRKVKAKYPGIKVGGGKR